MALPTCPKCDSHLFETQVIEPRNAHFKLVTVQCAMCGAVVGVVEYLNIGNEIGKLGKAIKAIAQKVGASVEL